MWSSSSPAPCPSRSVHCAVCGRGISRECAAPVGVRPANSDRASPRALRVLGAAGRVGGTRPSPSELAAGIARVKSAQSIGVRTRNWLPLKQAQALLNAPDITHTHGLRDRAIIAVLLGCALRRSEVAALTMGLHTD